MSDNGEKATTIGRPHNINSGSSVHGAHRKSHEFEVEEDEFDEKLKRSLASSKARSQLTKALIIGTITSLIELIGGLIIGSLALVADAVHDGFDSLSFGLSLFFLILSQRRGNEKFTYG